MACWRKDMLQKKTQVRDGVVWVGPKKSKEFVNIEQCVQCGQSKENKF